MKNKRRKEVDIPSTIEWNNITASNGTDVSNLFASFFESIYINTEPPDHPSDAANANGNGGNNPDANLAEFVVCYDDVLRQQNLTTYLIFS